MEILIAEKELFIGEKPSVGRAIAESLSKSLGLPMRSVSGTKGPTHIEVGSNIKVSWLFGHILKMSQPETYDPVFKSWEGSKARLPFFPEEWKLEPVSAAKEQLDVIKKLAKEKGLTRIIHAGDPDREGQLLVDEVLYFLGNKIPVQRILPNAMDADSMKLILATRRNNKELEGWYHSGLGRSRADFLVGINFTRAATLANQKSGMRGVLSIGRVQTVVLAIVAHRDNEIESFKPKNFFDIAANFKHANGNYTAKWRPSKSQKGMDSEGRLTDEAVANALVAAAAGKQGKISDYRVEDGSQRAPLPFSLSSLQIKASSMFGFGAQKVLDICQSLYEKHKVATYPRTDCQYLPETQFAGSSNVLKAISNFDPSLGGLVAGSNSKIKSSVWNSKNAPIHHAIIPTNNANYGALSPDERKIFGLICKFYVAQFYPNFSYKQTSVNTECGGQNFTSSGRTPVDLGWRKVFTAEESKNEDAKGSNASDNDGQMLPRMATGDNVQCENLSKNKKQTKPPAPYTEGTLIRSMTNVHEIEDDPEMKRKLKEIKGIGTEATRPAMIEKLKERQFIEIKMGKVRSTQAGRDFIKVLPKELIDVSMTAMWESLLDKVQEGVLPLPKFMEGITHFVTKTTKLLLESDISIAVGVKSADMAQAIRVGAGGSCPSCGKGVMGMRQAKKGDNAGNYFLGCSNFPNCKNTAPIEGQDQKKGGAPSKSTPPSAAPRPAFSRPGASGPAGTRFKS